MPFKPLIVTTFESERYRTLEERNWSRTPASTSNKKTMTLTATNTGGNEDVRQVLAS